ncbi:MAG: coproporphyrinogen dehydrogenase HemZ [Lachnospiraceae bacterium]|nr:coproporphyrinogen dehydrogenase HemZ [Lachnospiraceae bacterium]
MKQIYAYIKGLDYGQDIGPLIKAFFRDCDVKTINSEEAEEEKKREEAKIKRGHGQVEVPETVGVVNFVLNDTDFSIEAEIYGKSGSAFEDFSQKPELTYQNEGDPDRRMYRNHLHRALYNILADISGRKLPWGTLTGVRPTKQVLDMRAKGYASEDIIAFYENEYLASIQKARLALKVTENEEKILSGLTFDDTYSLYVGVPFCPSICLYCSFSSYPYDRFKNYAEPYVSAVLKEIEATAEMMKGKRLISVYFGGGTPTTLSAEQLRTIIRKIKECFDLKDLREWTIEAGRPDSITREKLEAMKEEGISRISVNPQSMQQKTLDLIGRRHTVEDVVNAFRLARECGFDNINMDLIAGLNGETLADFKDTLRQIGELDPDSVTVHTLAVKRAARLNAEMDTYGDSLSTETGLMTEEAERFMAERGYEPYYLYRQKNMSENLENVGYAKPGKEGLYNVLIMEECHTIAACGPGASSKLVRSDECFGGGFMNDAYDGEYKVRKIERTENVKSVKDYVERTEEMIERKRKLFSEPF